MPSVEAEIEFELECLECGSSLEDGSSRRRNGVEVISVKPCTYCMGEAQEEGRAEGVEK